MNDDEGHKAHHDPEAGKPVYMVARFPTERSLRAAERALKKIPGIASIERRSVADRSQSIKEAHEGFTGVTLGRSAWIGLLVGSLLGILFGLLLWEGIIAIYVLAPSFSAREPAVILLWAGSGGAAGWLAGSLIRLFSRAQQALGIVTPIPVSSSAARCLLDHCATEVVVEEATGRLNQ